MANFSGVIAIPTLERPEFLALALEKISEAWNVPGDVHIYLDSCSLERREETEYVRDTFYPTADIFYSVDHVKAVSGSWNILYALKDSYVSGADYVFLIEEDVLIKPNFFAEHLRMQRSDDYFVTCGRKAFNRNPGTYSNPGTCYRREKLAEVIPYICDDYFSAPEDFLLRYFPPYDEAGWLDDGLIQRVIREEDGKIGWADPPIACHQGFHYYNRLPQFRNDGPIERRITQLRDMLSRVDPTDRYSKDFEKF